MFILLETVQAARTFKTPRAHADLLVRHIKIAHEVENIRNHFDTRRRHLHGHESPHEDLTTIPRSSISPAGSSTQLSSLNLVSPGAIGATASGVANDKTTNLTNASIDIGGYPHLNHNVSNFIEDESPERQSGLHDLVPQPQPFSIDAPGDENGSIFAEIDGIDWLWRNDIYNSLLSIPLPDNNFLSGLGDSLMFDGVGHGINANAGVTRMQDSAVSTSELPEDVLQSQPHLPVSPSSHPVDFRGNEPQVESTLWTLDEEVGTTGDPCCPWRVTKSSYEQICSNISQSSTSLPLHFTMPSRHTLSRFADGYFRGFHEHLPFLHLPTLLLTDIPAELMLSIVAMGALYKFEHGKAYELYFSAKELVTSRLRELTWAYSRHLVGVSPNYEGTSTGLQPVPSTSTTAGISPSDSSSGGSEVSDFLNPDKIIRLMQALVDSLH
ncbi:hypothetical protein QQZ08_009146 [Neonectria magnoliae]|uniref:Transcription factor domain-containing protein n=1 Tax=Neonectria magnoliae TaxID=2732573 RepID=A0ABR1HPT5_9HYPO